MASQFYPELFEPGRIGQMALPNRLVMAPMGTSQATGEGHVTQELKDYYEARARSGLGLVIVEATGVKLPQDRGRTRSLGVDDDKCLTGLAELTAVIHHHGAKAALQINHSGRMGRAADPADLIAPSAVPASPSHQVPREMSAGDIEEMIGRYAAAARRTQQAGFDGVEIHGAHHYLIAQFLSGAANRREDEWGGSLRNRARFLLETIRAIRREVGARYPVWCRLSGKEYGLEGGISLEETEQVAQWAEEAGCDAISVSAYGVRNWAAVQFPHTPGALIPLVENIKKKVTVPVMAAGRLGPALGCRIIREGKADFVAIGRALLADADWVPKVARGRIKDIRPCIGCHKCLEIVTESALEGVKCTVNPALGQERAMAPTMAAQAKKVLVIGGGPAGMEAALVAAQRGYQVTLWERGDRLGGQLLVADKAPRKNHVRALRNYFINQLQEQGVEVALGKEATPGAVAELQPQAVVLATGSTPFLPQIPGLEKRPVFTAVDVLAGKAAVGQRVVVIGAEMVGCEVANFLAHQGKQVTMTRRGKHVATHLNAFARREMRDRLEADGVQVLTAVNYEKVTEEGMVITNAAGKRQTLKADTIVVAVGSHPNGQLLAELQKGYKVHPAGDCVEPLTLWHAIYAGHQAGLAV